MRLCICKRMPRKQYSLCVHIVYTTLPILCTMYCTVIFIMCACNICLQFVFVFLMPEDIICDVTVTSAIVTTGIGVSMTSSLLTVTAGQSVDGECLPVNGSHVTRFDDGLKTRSSKCMNNKRTNRYSMECRRK